MYSLALIIFVVSEKKAFENFAIGSNVNLFPAVVAILDGGRGHRT
jgi:predicted metalloprotease